MYQKTLLERIKPEYLETLKAKHENYPHLWQIIETELSSTFFFTNLRYGTALDLSNHTDVPIREIYSLFFND